MSSLFLHLLTDRGHGDKIGIYTYVCVYFTIEMITKENGSLRNKLVALLNIFNRS